MIYYVEDNEGIRNLVTYTLNMTGFEAEGFADGEAFFKALEGKGIATVSVIGVAADYCVRWAVDGLVARGFAVEVPAALTRGIDRQFDQVLAEDFAGCAVSLA